VRQRGSASTRLLGPFLLRHWPALVASMGATVVLTTAQLAQPWPLKLVIDRLLGRHQVRFQLGSSDLALLGGVAALVLLFAAVGAAAQYASDLLADTSDPAANG
jgi:ABC-type multidrug transport system fused ATPase/permease subunit